MNWAALAAVGAQAGTDLTGGFVNINQSEIAREFTKDMAGSAYQFKVNDLRKAGLNPLLALDGGAGGGHSAQMAQWGGSRLGETINSASKIDVERKLAEAEVGKKQAETDTLRMTASAKASEMELNKALADRARQGILLDAQNARYAGANARTVELQLPKRELMSEGWRGATEALGGKGLGARAADTYEGVKNWLGEIPQKWREIFENAPRGSASDAYSRGRGNVHGGAHSAASMKSH